MKRRSESISSSENKRNKSKNIIDCNKWISASSLRNYMLDDPLLDWLKFKDFKGTSPGTSPGTSGTTANSKFSSGYDEFTEYIMEKGIEFETRIYEDLSLKFGDKCVRVSFGVTDIISTQKAEETSKLILKGKPIIYNGVLHNPKTKTYGAPDLIVRSDYVNRICPKTLSSDEVKQKAANLKGKYHYVILDIKYCCLHLKANGENLLNTGSIPAYKAQLYIYTEALSQIQGMVTESAYILGRSYSYKSKGESYSGTGCYDKLGRIDFKKSDIEYVEKAKEAIEWLTDLRKYGSTWKLYPRPSRIELYPNMCNTRDAPYTKMKKEIAERLNDITIIWQCGPKHRLNAFDNNVYSWKDKKCTAELLGHRGPVIAPIVQKMLEFNTKPQYSNVFAIPEKIESAKTQHWRKPKEKEFFLDCEIITNVFDDLTALPQISGKTLVFLIGVGYIKKGEWTVKSFIAPELTEVGEEEMMIKFTRWLKKKIQDLVADDYNIYHWTSADQNFINSAFDRHPEINPLFIKYFDVYEIFKKEPVLIKNVFDFGLKSIISALNKGNKIQFKPKKSSCGNGTQAMIQAWKCYSNRRKHVKKQKVFKEIIDYNCDDCRSVYEILMYLRLNHT